MESAFTVMRVSLGFLLVIRVIDDECKLSFWCIEVFDYYVYILVYQCRSSLEQEIKLVLSEVTFCCNRMKLLSRHEDKSYNEKNWYEMGVL